MPLILQFAVRFAVGEIFGALARRQLVATATRFGASTSGVGAKARLFLAGNAIGNEIADFLIDDVVPRMRDQGNWSREAAVELAERVLLDIRANQMRGPYPEKLRSQTGESARNIRIEERGESVAIGSPDPWMMWFEKRDDTKRWRDRRWLEPALENVIRDAPELYVRVLERSVQ